MSPTDPQFLYMVLILPSLFGLTLIGEGLNKIIKEEKQGWASFLSGVLFIATAILVFFFISSSL